MPEPTGPTATATRPVTPVPVPSRRWWRRPWVVPLAVVVVAFVGFSLPPYLTLDPARSRVAAPDTPLPYFPLLVVHVLAGSVAILTCVAQVWPWLRRRHPVLHRRLGRVYVFAGVLPAGLTALLVGAVSPFGPVARVSSAVVGTLWVGCTLAGWRAARRRRYAAHRRWMVRSFALTVSIVTNRIWGVVWVLALAPDMAAVERGDQQLVQTAAGITTWLGWVLPWLVAQWWLDRRPAPAGPATVTGTDRRA